MAPLSLSYGAKAFGVAPGVLTRVQAALGYDNVAAQMEEGQRHIRWRRPSPPPERTVPGRIRAISFASRSGWSSGT